MTNKSTLAVIAYLTLITILAAILFTQRHSPWLYHLSMAIGLNKRGQMRQSMINLRQISIALEKYALDNGDLYPPPPVPAKPFLPQPWDARLPSYDSLPQADNFLTLDSKREVRHLRDFLVPKYIDAIPLSDYWGNPFYYDISADRSKYALISVGSDSHADTQIMYWFPSSDTTRDIVLYDTVFLSTPEGDSH